MASTEQHNGTGNKAATLIGLGLVALIGWEVGATMLQHRARPQPGDWRAAAQQLRQLRKGDEPILVAPRWADPIGRLHLSGMLDNAGASLSDADRFPRVWQLSIRGARHPWLDAAERSQTWSFGRLKLSLYHQPPVDVLYDFRERLAEATVSVVGERLEPCVPEGDRFSCPPRRSWSWVGPHLGEVGFQPVSCVYAHPLPNKRLLITFPAVPLGRQLVGYTGIADYISRRDAKTPVLLQTFVDGQLAASVMHVSEAPWTRFEADTSRFAGAEHEVRFDISAEQTRYRTFCFHAEARR